MGTWSSKPDSPHIQELRKKDNTCPKYAKIIHTHIESYYGTETVYCDKDGKMMALTRDNRIFTWSFINNSDDSIIKLKSEDIDGKPRNFKFTPTNYVQINIWSDRKKLDPKKVGFRAFNKKYWALEKWQEWIVFIPMAKLDECLDSKSNKDYNIDITNNCIDQTKFKDYMLDGFDFHSIKYCFLFNDKDKYVVWHYPKTNWRHINFYIFCCKTHKLIRKIENKIGRPSNYSQKFNNRDNIYDISITDNSISFWVYPLVKFEYDKDFLLNVTEYGRFASNEIIPHLSPSGKYSVHYGCNQPENRRFHISAVAKDGQLTPMYDFEVENNLYVQQIPNRYYSMKIQHWHNDDILIGYDYQKSIFIFQNAKSNMRKHEILLDRLGTNNLVNIMLEMIGFEFVGSWLCHYIGLYDYRQSKNIRGLVRLLNVRVYFGKYKRYAMITAYNGCIKTILVELDDTNASKTGVKELNLDNEE